MKINAYMRVKERLHATGATTGALSAIRNGRQSISSRYYVYHFLCSSYQLPSRAGECNRTMPLISNTFYRANRSGIRLQTRPAISRFSSLFLGLVQSLASHHERILLWAKLIRRFRAFFAHLRYFPYY